MFTQKGVDGGNKRRVGMRQTKVMLDGRCEDSLGQQNNGGRGCTSMHERLERV